MSWYTKEWEATCLQARDKVLWRASDHGPAARIHRVLVPVLQHAMRILEVVLDHHESLNCKGNKNCHYTNATKEPITWFFNLRVTQKGLQAPMQENREQTQEPR